LDDALHFLEERNLKANHMTLDDPPDMYTATGLKDVGNLGERAEFRVDPPRLLLFSAYDEAAMKRFEAKYKSYFDALHFTSQDEFETYMADLAHTLNTRRSTLPSRSFLIASSLSNLRKMKTISSSVQQRSLLPTLAFVFTGQGAQWEGMGHELFSYPIFDRKIMELETFIECFGCKWSLKGLTFGIVLKIKSLLANTNRYPYWKYVIIGYSQS
jgi:acyl transferase domain-containing protein